MYASMCCSTFWYSSGDSDALILFVAYCWLRLCHTPGNQFQLKSKRNFNLSLTFDVCVRISASAIGITLAVRDANSSNVNWTESGNADIDGNIGGNAFDNCLRYNIRSDSSDKFQAKTKKSKWMNLMAVCWRGNGRPKTIVFYSEHLLKWIKTFGERVGCRNSPILFQLGTILTSHPRIGNRVYVRADQVRKEERHNQNAKEPNGQAESNPDFNRNPTKWSNLLKNSLSIEWKCKSWHWGEQKFWRFKHKNTNFSFILRKFSWKNYLINET